MTTSLKSNSEDTQVLKAHLDWLYEKIHRGSASNRSLEESIALSDSASEAGACSSLAEIFHLSSYECNLLLMSCATELDSRFCELYQTEINQPFPTFAMAMQLFADASWNAISPHSALRKYQLLHVEQQHGVPLVHSPLVPNPRIVNFLNGLNELDHRLNEFCIPSQTNLSVPLPESLDAVVHELQNTIQHGRCAHPPLLGLTGASKKCREQVAIHLAQRMRATLLKVSATSIPTNPTEQIGLANLWLRESALLPLILLISVEDDSPSALRSLDQFCSRLPGVVLLDSKESVGLNERSMVAVDVPLSTAEEQLGYWLTLTNDQTTSQRIVGQFNFDFLSIQEIFDLCLHENNQGFDLQRLWRTCRNYSRPQLSHLAQRIELKATWDQIVLPDEHSNQLREIAAHIRQRPQVYNDWGFADRDNRGLGVSVLFSGESGTGKTMAAEVLAADLELDLYRIDLSAIVNKYIGETEKNLRNVFDAAETGGVVLFFDEADALFGTRTDVKDSHDRYANIETNYLLQRIESFRGLVILATNHKSNIDSAFLRRLRYVVQFAVPDQELRQEMWERAFPAATPCDGVDAHHLSQLPFTGGNINTVALNAAFGSACDASSVDMPHILKSAQRECAKLKKTSQASLFHWNGTGGGS